MVLIVEFIYIGFRFQEKIILLELGHFSKAARAIGLAGT